MANEPVAKLRKLQESAQALLGGKGLESPDGGPGSGWQAAARFWVLVGKHFVRNRCPVRASALAYTTLLSLIPLLGVAVSVTTALVKNTQGAPVQQLIENLVSNVAPALNLQEKPAGDQEDANLTSNTPAAAGNLSAGANPAHDEGGSREVARRISQFIDNIRGGALGATSMVALVFVAISLLATIEATFNDIWGVPRGRNWVVRVIYYWTAITLGPLALIVAFGLNLGPYLKGPRRVLEMMPLVGTLLYHILPVVVLALAFTVFYRLMPNTKVHWKAALAGGFVGGLLFHLNNKFSVIYVSKVVAYSKIYGSLGMVPVFLVGLYFSWVIVLFGAQVAYAFQNRRAYERERRTETLSQHRREFFALRLMTLAGVRFCREQPPPTGADLAVALEVPSHLLGEILQALVNAKLLVEVAGAEAAYTPARPLEQVTCRDVLTAMRAGPANELDSGGEPSGATVRSEFERITIAEAQAASALTLLGLVNRVRSGETGGPDQGGPIQVPS
jgi:membrane protein